MLGGGWLKLKPGQVTDDTTMSLALGDAIVERSGFQTPAVADSFARWLRARPVNVGNACRRGIQRYMTQRTLAGVQSDGDAGNGACMRNLPVALFSLDTMRPSKRTASRRRTSLTIIPCRMPPRWRSDAWFAG